ncbi:C2 domain protein [Sporothrix schenckii 1099-18]|uniref:C2 domain-containing protein n=2 Tax=Sporothrix schenckii TaxID=29908 RepID=U7PMB3_SPOS1|nr:C2 domain protein [Sporothrix schenckii 1099-18]ERS95650.1 hypothetical protein HMPREF1624_07724 [Sporothrix schenckii ATCC 58251]KJR83664.1 C2 domain protein [Sporothrix schenckii 1099-18]
MADTAIQPAEATTSSALRTPTNLNRPPSPTPEAPLADTSNNDENSANQPRTLPSHIKTRIATQKDKITDKTERLRDKEHPPGGYDDTPLPTAAGPTYTLKFTFHRATNLPVADFGSSSSDPFIRATLTVPAVTKRHDEDPDMVHRTRTIHKTTEPVWDEEWVVAGIPASNQGFKLKCRLYDEDSTDHDDRLGNVTVEVPSFTGHNWPGIEHATFDVKKRMGSKRAYLLKAAAAALTSTKLTPTLELSISVVGEDAHHKEDGQGMRMYTVGPTGFVRHFSPMIGRITNTLVNRDERHDEDGAETVQDAHAPATTAPSLASAPDHTTTAGNEKSEKDEENDKKAADAQQDKASGSTKKYDFQANEIQLQGPVPSGLYHRYVEFRPIIGRMFSSHGLRGRILNKALHKQHNRVYNFSRSTEYGAFPPCSDEASLQFLKLAHFDEGGRIFTYMISLDGVFRFTETGKEFGIDLLSKHTMHSDVATYIAISGEFFIRRLADPSGSSNPQPGMPTHPPAASLSGGPPDEEPPTHQPGYYQLIIDNDSGTYRPDKSLLPLLKEFLERNFPGLGIVCMHWEDETLQKMKSEQHESKKREGGGMHLVLNRSPSSSSVSSSDESRLSDMDDDIEGAHTEGGGGHGHHKTKKEVAWDLLEDPSRIKDLHSAMLKHKISDEK